MATKKTERVEPTPEEETTPVAVTKTPAAPLTFTRGVVAAGTAGLLLAGGLAGFGIAHATDDDGPGFSRSAHMRPGHGGPGWDGQRGPRGNRGDERGPRQDGGQIPPLPGQGGPQDVRPDTQQDEQPPTTGPGDSTSGT